MTSAAVSIVLGAIFWHDAWLWSVMSAAEWIFEVARRHVDVKEWYHRSPTQMRVDHTNWVLEGEKEEEEEEEEEEEDMRGLVLVAFSLLS